ncbi:MAG: TIGR03619 family F420-dependent LLM class oxidoreductase [Solirubrobacterales bacterium]|nr:TIGR03619 family F420-dependent LLM class oxidoreductase [Solirubrobacterales bacterium]
MGNLKFGLALENFTPAEKVPDVASIVTYARRAEELGYESLWAWDHMFLGSGRPFPFLESLSTLALLTAHTERAELGTGILVLPLRRAAVLAKTAASIEIMSGGRLTLGMAVGWYEREFDACGVPFKQRGKIFEENLALMKEFWTGERVSGSAGGIEFRNAVMLPTPAPRPRPRLLIGGYVDRVLRRVAEKGDGWLTYFYEPDPFSSAWRRIREHAEAAGRDPDELDNVAQLPLCIDDSFEAADARARRYIHDYFDLPAWSESTAESAIRGTPEQCAEQIAAQAAAGVQHICLCPCNYEIEQVERFAAEVMPLVSGLAVEGSR